MNMKFERGHDWNLLNNTSLMGYIDTSYDQLVQVFGEPDKGSVDGKTDAEWLIQFEDGTVAGIHNYKDGPAYLGEEGTPVNQIREWHVSGVKGSRALDFVKETLGDAATITYRYKVS